MKFGTMFSGGELAAVGIRAAGLAHAWGLEIDDDIANVARLNGFGVVTADVLETDPADLEPVDALHASPECQRASVANQGAGETDLDLAFGRKIAQFINVMQPKIFTLENVYPYRNFAAFGYILATLDRLGYWYDYQNINATDFGVPQTRRRLILRALRGSLLPPLPQPERWVGWYEAIEDLIPSLPESEFAPWQLERLPGEMAKPWLIGSINAGQEWGGTKFGDAPSMTITAEQHPRAFILSNAKTERGDGIRQDDEPSHTVTGEANGRTRAWLVGTNANDSSGAKIYQDADEPAQTIKVPSGGRVMRAWLSQGRVVKLTPRALARLQSVPDWYRLPDSPRLACKIIGNGVPPLLMEKIYKQLVSVL